MPLCVSPPGCNGVCLSAVFLPVSPADITAAGLCFPIYKKEKTSLDHDSYFSPVISEKNRLQLSLNQEGMFGKKNTTWPNGFSEK